MRCMTADDWPDEKPLPRTYWAPEDFPAGYWVGYATGRDVEGLRRGAHLGEARDEG